MKPLNLTPADIRAMAVRVGFDCGDERVTAFADLVQQEIAVRVLANMRRKPPGAAVADNFRTTAGVGTRTTAGVVKRCQATQHSDQMLCGRCGLGWDVNDVEPPKCAPVERRLTVRRDGDG